MDFQLHQREKEGIQILDLGMAAGSVGDSEATLRTAMDELAEAGGANIVVNFAGVTEMDDEGFAILSSCCSSSAGSGASIKKLNINTLDASLIVITKLHTMWEAFTDEQDAVNSFFPGRVIGHFDILEWVQEQESVSPSLLRVA